MHCLVFDDRGEVWDANSRELAEGLNASIGGDALTSYAIKNLGFIAATVINESVRIRLRPAVVSQVALSGLLYWLHDQPFHRVLLSFLDSDWSHELVRSRQEAASRLLARVRFKSEDREGDFLNKARALQDLSPGSPLRELLNLWSDHSGKYDGERLSPLLDKALNGRFVLFEAASGSNSVYVKEVGPGLGRSGAFWLSRTKGLRVEDQPDYAYGKWVSEAYRDVLNTREPLLDDVDAVITWPQQPRVSYRYRRLVVPFAGRDASTLLLSATVIDPDISLRVKSG